MSTFFYGGHHHPQAQSHPHHNPNHGHQAHQHTLHINNHHGRSRRTNRPAASQNPSRQFRPRQTKDVNIDAPNLAAFRVRFEAGRSFDLDDDLEFCPYLLTDDERLSINSGLSDRSSLSSGSPNGSPIQQQSQPQPQPQVTPTVSLATNQQSFTSPNSSAINNQVKLHQPSAVRTRNAIPIVNPTTGMRIASPPSSISPSMMQQATPTPRW